MGNTERLAGHLAELSGCRVHRLEPIERYPRDYDAMVALNVREQEEAARPGLVDPLTSLAPLDILLIGSPIWNSEIPRLMRTFVDTHDFTGITVAPFTTHAGSGLGGAPDEYRQACRGAAAIAAGLAVRGEDVGASRDRAAAWLGDLGILPGRSGS